jgi:hypothetical protein
MDNGNQTQSVKPSKSDSFLDKQLERHKELSITVRRTMFTMLAYGVSCAVIIAQPDVPFVLTSSGVQIPVINVAVNLKAFLLVGPLGLIAITIYLHLFIAKLDGLTGLDEYDKQPFLFNFQDSFSRLLKFLIFYAPPPFLMLGFSWKAAVFDEEWRIAMYFVTIVLTFGMFLIYLKPKLKDRQLITVIFLIIGIFVSIGMTAFLSLELGIHVTRHLNLERAQLTEAKLPQVNLAEANLQFANLSKADLRGAYLVKADLRGANLSGANFKGAIFEFAYLHGTILDETTELDPKWQNVWELLNRYEHSKDQSGANLSSANLSEANLSEANLREANLREANLSEAELRFANLSGGKELTFEQLCKASTLYGAKFDQELVGQIKQECPDLLKKAQKD